MTEVPIPSFTVVDDKIVSIRGHDTSSYDKAVAEMLAIRRPPEGYAFVVDARTDTLLMNGPRLAFCITRKAIEDGRHLTDFAAVLEALIAAHNKTETAA